MPNAASSGKGLAARLAMRSATGRRSAWGKTCSGCRSASELPKIPIRTVRARVAVLYALRYFGLDNIVVPRSGFQIEASTSWYSRQKPNLSFPQSEFRASYFKPVSKPGSLLFTASGGTTYGTKTLNLELQLFTLGGPLRLGAYGENELLGNQYFLTQGGYLHKLASISSIFGEGLYGLVFMEVGKVYDSPASILGSSLALDGSVALVARTAIGPVFVGGSIGNDSHRKWWFG
jgi:NTE family protein